jgi:hypothetical protein
MRTYCPPHLGKQVAVSLGSTGFLMQIFAIVHVRFACISSFQIALAWAERHLVDIFLRRSGALSEYWLGWPNIW